jgi:hypothetical protein
MFRTGADGLIDMEPFSGFSGHFLPLAQNYSIQSCLKIAATD